MLLVFWFLGFCCSTIKPEKYVYIYIYVYRFFQGATQQPKILEMAFLREAKDMAHSAVQEAGALLAKWRGKLRLLSSSYRPDSFLGAGCQGMWQLQQ